MKKGLVFLIFLFPTSIFAEKYLTYAESPGAAVGFANSVVTYTPGSGASGSGVIQDSVLGAPDGNYLSLGKKGSVVVRIGPNALKADGTTAVDLYVYEGGWWDSFDVYVSSNNVDFTKLTVTTSNKSSGGTGSWLGFNLDSQVDRLLSYPYVKIVDTSNSTSTVTGTDGADIDGLVITSAAPSIGNYMIYDTDSLNGSIYNLYKDRDKGAVGVKIIGANGAVSYIPFSDDGTLEPIALSVQTDLNGDSANDVEVLVTRKSDNTQLNLIRDMGGSLLKVIDNGVIK